VFKKRPVPAVSIDDPDWRKPQVLVLSTVLLVCANPTWRQRPCSLSTHGC
jgi:hypothetical protein